MFFFFSKTIDFLVMPLTWICAAVLAAILFKKPKIKQRLLWVAAGLLFFFCNDFISNEVMYAWEIRTTPYSEMRQHELAIVLTGATQSEIKPADRVYFNKGADRVTHTVQLYKMGLVKKILISGGIGKIGENYDDVPEANKFEQAMILMGVDEGDIILENKTRNTYESAQRVKPMLDSLHYNENQCLLVTSAFHMRRSLACYKKVGLNIMPFTTDFYTHRRTFSIGPLLVPQPEALHLWHKLFKEWAGLFAYKLTGHV
ncbi:MAG: YdcF family protein [Chryseolinea sp.]